MPLPSETNAGLVQAEAKDQQYYLDLFDRIFPEEYLAPLKAPGPGYEIFQAIAAMGERLSLAVARVKIGNYLETADGGQFAQADVYFSRPTAAAGAVIVKAGTVVTTSIGDRRFTLLADVVFGAADVGPLLGSVQAVAQGYEYNVRGPRISAGGETLPGEIDTILQLIESPAFGDGSITVSQVDDASGGQAAMLDQLGIDRGIARTTNEADPSYRSRVSTLPDTVSPAAIQRALDAVMQSLGLAYGFIETWDSAYQGCFDAPDAAIPGSTFDPNLFCPDDPRTGTFRFVNRYLDDVEVDGTFIVVVPTALSAANVRGIWDLLQQIKAAGVVAGIEQDGN